MSAAAPTADAGAAPPKKGKKKLIIIIAAVLLLAVAGGGVAFYLKQKAAKAAAEAESEDGAAPAADSHAAGKVDPKHPPSFLPLDPFTVNLADKEVERYAQIGITLEVDDAVFAEQMKTYMPAVRNAILMILAHKTSEELLTLGGKEALAAEIMREAVRPMGLEIEVPEHDEKAAHGKGAAKDGDHADAEDDPDVKPKTKKKKKKPAVHNPVQHVLFSNFIIQ